MVTDKSPLAHVGSRAQEAHRCELAGGRRLDVGCDLLTEHEHDLPIKAALVGSGQLFEGGIEVIGQAECELFHHGTIITLFDTTAAESYNES